MSSSSSRHSPSHLSRFSSLPVSTAGSSPPHHPSSYASSEAFDSSFLINDDEEKVIPVEETTTEQEPPLEPDEEAARRLARLKFVLEKSAVYSTFLHQRMEEDKLERLQAQKAKKATVEQTRRGRKKRGRIPDEGDGQAKRLKGENGEAVPVEPDDQLVFEQPALVTGAKLKKYQLEGLQWMVSLDQNGISGILADEMGLGKTLQTIAFSAYLREHQNTRPFLVICPLNVLHNWYDEYQKFAPSIPVCIYHGTPEERAELRRTVMALPGSSAAPTKKQSKGKKSKMTQTKLPFAKSSKLQAGKAANPIVVDKPEGETDRNVGEDEDPTANFPIIVTTYEMIIKDRKHLARYNWGYIVVDEGHRLKNLNCTLMREVKKYPSAGRMILTGTPLHNNLSELWSLMNFVLPDIFDDLDSFQEWFNLPTLRSSLPTDQSTQIISSLHAILKPFLLRRLKVDVLVKDENGNGGIPPKKEYVIYAPLSLRQKEAYECVLNGNIRQWLLAGGTKKAGAKLLVEHDEDDEVHIDGQASTSQRKLRKQQGKKNYALDGDDDEYFEMLEKGVLDERGFIRQLSKAEEQAEQKRAALEHQAKTKRKIVNNMRLQNMAMQLRKVCSHPFLFDWPIDPKTNEPILGAELVNASGKMMVLDRLLKELLRRGHRVLIFSQFVTALDILEDWATGYMGWEICRIDGSTSPQERREQMQRFQKANSRSPRIFLLSTRAGGLGINLTAADTVIFYDQDWNPQMDAQAQDRAHRIGQTKPVLVYRLVTAHTIEDKILQCATEKRRLEALVIAKGKFKMPASAAPSAKQMTTAEVATELLRLEVEKIDVVPDTKEGKEGVLSDRHLDMLLDRSPEVFESRGLGWTSQMATEGAAADQDGDHHKTGAFAVFEAPTDEGNDALATMLGDDLAS